MTSLQPLQQPLPVPKTSHSEVPGFGLQHMDLGATPFSLSHQPHGVHLGHEDFS